MGAVLIKNKNGTMRVYEKFGMYPDNSCPKNVYNLWEPFAYSLNKIPEILQKNTQLKKSWQKLGIPRLCLTQWRTEIRSMLASPNLREK